VTDWFVCTDAKAVVAAVSFWKRKRSRQTIAVSAATLFGLNLRSNFMLKSLIFNQFVVY